MTIDWTIPYFGIIHSNTIDGNRCSVRKLEKGAILAKWYPGCQFSPIESFHKSVDEAKVVAMKWMLLGG